MRGSEGLGVFILGRVAWSGGRGTKVGRKQPHSPDFGDLHQPNLAALKARKQLRHELLDPRDAVHFVKAKHVLADAPRRQRAPTPARMPVPAPACAGNVVCGRVKEVSARGGGRRGQIVQRQHHDVELVVARP